MEKGRLRTPGPLAWASGTAAEGDCVPLLLAGQPDHPDPGTAWAVLSVFFLGWNWGPLLSSGRQFPFLQHSGVPCFLSPS